jgi:ribosomal protein L11 methyltransferase
MPVARFILSSPALSLDGAQALAERIEGSLTHEALAVTINEIDEAASQWQTSVYFPDEAEAQAARAEFGGTISALPDTDWVRQSLDGLAPVRAGRFFLHGSHDRSNRATGGIALEIDAGTAFGTGHHGTTEGCLMALDLLLKSKKPRHILDVGCGTGVLAIAASKAARVRSIATDIDPEAVRVTALNARGNGVGPLVETFAAPGLKDRRFATRAPYDLIFANILARPLVALARGLSLILKSRGHLVLSGLTQDQARWISATYRNHGLVPVNRINRGNWVTLVLTKLTRKHS